MLFQYVEKHGKVLYNLINSAVSERKVFFIHGGIDAEEREEARAITEKENDAIIIASYGTFSTGINIRNLHNIIFASPSKSRIRNLQSIGRGLRKGDKKSVATLYDISDDLSYKSWNNFTLKHFAVRVKMYNEEEFDYKIYNIRLKNDNSNSKTDKRRDNTSKEQSYRSNDKITVVDPLKIEFITDYAGPAMHSTYWIPLTDDEISIDIDMSHVIISIQALWI